MKNNITEFKIKQYLQGEASQVEMEALINWLNDDEGNRELFAKQKNEWVTSNTEEFEGLKTIQGKVQVVQKIKNLEYENSLKRVKRINFLLKYAASFLLLTTLGFSAFYFYSTHTRKQSENFSLIAGNEIRVPYGSKSQIILPDGSKVWVNAGSKIKYNAGFGISSRKLHLEGEAYFDVTKNEKIPFIIETDLFNIKVYGTSFNVKSYLDDDIAETTLDEGSISIFSKDNSKEIMNLSPKQKAIIPRIKLLNDTKSSVSNDKNNNTDKQLNDISFNIEKDVDTKIVTAWKDNRLVFEQEPLNDLAKRLERQYNVVFHFIDKDLRSFRYTAALKEMPIEQVLQAIALVTPIKYKIEGINITLSKNENFKCPTNLREM